MRIVVPIKQVPETSNVKMDPETGTMIRKNLEAIINPLDLYAIEAALQIREKEGGEVITISMGPPNAIKALKEAVAMGCDSGVLLSDRKFGGADTWATAYTLVEGIKKIGRYDLIICGERATDGDTGQVGPGIASFLDMPLATYVSRIYDITSEGLRVERLVEGGKEINWSPLPMVITVLKDIASPRLPTLGGMQKAKRETYPVWGKDDLEVNEEWLGLKGSPTRVVKINTPKVTRQGELLTIKNPQEMEAAADKVVDFLQAHKII